MSQPKVNPDFTFGIAKIISNLSIAKMHAECMAVEQKGTAKKMLSNIAHRCVMAQKEVTELLTPASMEIVKNDLMTTECFGMIDNITTVILALPVEMRNEIEDYVLSKYNQYASSKVA